MIAVAPLDSASSWLTWSNVVYVGGAVLTLTAAMHVLYEKRAFASGKRKTESFLSEAMVIAAAFVSLLGTIGAIHFGNVVSKLKDDDLAQYKKAADIKIAQSEAESKIASQKSEEARLKTEQTSAENSQLRLDVSKEQRQARKSEAQLAKQNETTSRFTHALAVQQQTMAEQMHASPELTASQVEAVAALLKPFAGQEVIIHSTADTVVGRLGRGITAAFNQAHIQFPQYSIDMGQLYKGISVVVHAEQGHPPLADALVIALRQQGIPVDAVSLDSVPVGKVAIYLGPQ
jgi:hypothetical protein